MFLLWFAAARRIQKIVKQVGSVLELKLAVNVCDFDSKAIVILGCMNYMRKDRGDRIDKKGLYCGMA